MRTEDTIQAACVSYLDILAKQGRLDFFAVPNAARRNVRQASHLKRTGMRAGVSDLILLFPMGRIFFIEVKTPKGRLSDSQVAFNERVRALGHFTYVVHSVDELKGVIDAIEGRRNAINVVEV